MVGNDLIWRFTPSRTEPHVLEEIFVQRHGMLAHIVERVRESALTGNKHQILLIGPRGIGKTHLISLLHFRVTQDSALANKVQIAWLLEDETISSFVQLLKRIYELLAEEYPAEFSRSWLDDLLDRPPARILKALETALVDQFRDRTLLLFVENLDLLFEGLGDEGQTQWRAFLQNHPFTCIVATSQRLFKSVQTRERPFFGFFATEHLRPLPACDAVDLLRRIARYHEQTDLIAFLATPEGRSRVRALHHLAGGNHRIYIVLSGFITRESLDELTGPFEQMADELTPYYQERMRWLTPQQRQIVEYLCAREETCTPKEIARHLLATENTISSQLKKLLELGYVLRSPRGRESLYELAEPLIRLASEVKEKRRKPLRLLVHFLRKWYRPDVLPQLLAKAGTPSLRRHLRAAISQSRSTPDPRLQILEREIEKAEQENKLEDLLLVLEERARVRGSAKDWFDLAWCHDRLRKVEAALDCYDKALKIDPQHTSAWSSKGDVLASLGRDEAALECFDKALEIDPRDRSAWFRRGNLLSGLGQCDAAVGCYDKALEIEPQDAHVWNNKGLTLTSLGRHEAALDCYDKALEINPRGASAWNNKGSALADLGRHTAAIDCCDKALEIDPEDATAWNNKGYLLYGLGRDAAAITCFDNALEIQPRDAWVWTNKGHALSRLGRHEAARKCYERALELDSTDPLWAFYRCEPMFALRRWDAGFAGLRAAFERYPGDTSHDATDLIDLILRLSEGPEELGRNVSSLIATYHEAKVLVHLGGKLVRSLRRIDTGRLGVKALEDWREAWLELRSSHAELEIPLRIFRVGIEYLIQGDEKVLLDLVSVERKVLRQALRLDGADGVESSSQSGYRPRSAEIIGEPYAVNPLSPHASSM